MRKLKILLEKAIYALFAKWLPGSFAPIFGWFAKWMRKICGKLILTKCGKRVNIERGAVFSSKVSLGDNSGIGINAYLDGKVTIGDNVMMGPHCIIYSRNHEFDRLDIPMREQGFKAEKPVTKEMMFGSVAVL
jgi:maltose O-acetyltransferase